MYVCNWNAVPVEDCFSYSEQSPDAHSSLPRVEALQAFAPSMLACPLASSLFRSCLISHVDETSWVLPFWCHMLLFKIPFLKKISTFIIFHVVSMSRHLQLLRSMQDSVWHPTLPLRGLFFFFNYFCCPGQWVIKLPRHAEHLKKPLFKSWEILSLDKKFPRLSGLCFFEQSVLFLFWTHGCHPKPSWYPWF